MFHGHRISRLSLRGVSTCEVCLCARPPTYLQYAAPPFPSDASRISIDDQRACASPGPFLLLYYFMLSNRSLTGRRALKPNGRLSMPRTGERWPRLYTTRSGTVLSIPFCMGKSTRTVQSLSPAGHFFPRREVMSFGIANLALSALHDSMVIVA